MKSEEIVKALRTCVMDPDDGGDCENCPASRSEDDYCLTVVMSEAASLIEQLTAENVILPDGQASAIESLRKEIEWKDMVIALAQRKQTEAEAERDALREQLPCWIPVMERRPERGGKYLCVYSFRTMDDSPVRMSFPSVLDYYATDPVPHFQHEGVNEMHVTHWMPLPEAPEEGDKA